MFRATAIVLLLAFSTTIATADQIVLNAIAGAAENNGSGWLLETSSGEIDVGVSRFTSLERRGVMEYSLAAIPNDADVLTATLDIYFYFFNNPPLPNVQFNGYIGNGSIGLADITVPFNEIGRTGTFSSVQTLHVPINTAYIETLLSGGSDWLGMMAYQLTASGSAGYVAGLGQPHLTIEYVPEPATVALCLSLAFLHRRR